MHNSKERGERYALLCTLCARNIAQGEEYWLCNGYVICKSCLGEFARMELGPCRQRRGEEETE